jgi:hypothetical protein
LAEATQVAGLLQLGRGENVQARDPRDAASLEHIKSHDSGHQRQGCRKHPETPRPAAGVGEQGNTEREHGGDRDAEKAREDALQARM